MRTQCGGTQFVVENISTSTLANTVDQVGDTAFGITTPGWYQITLKGEAGIRPPSSAIGYSASGGILISNHQYSGDEIITIKAITGGYYTGTPGYKGGAGVALWDTVPVYTGMIIGEYAKGGDLEVNPVKEKHLTNIRAAGKDDNVLLSPPRKMSLEEAISYIADDELVEVTPESIRLRKEILDSNLRKRAEKRREE